MFQFELCSYPTALFNSSLLLLEPQKPALADAIFAKLSSNSILPTGKVQYVLDGGALIHGVPWPRGPVTYQEICNTYCSYVTHKYGGAIVVFDRYNTKSTKGMTQQRQGAGKVGATVTFSDNMKLTMKKDHFLSNKSNKQSFINMLSRYLQIRGCQTHHSEADVLIAKTANNSSRESTTVLVGDDTDLLILLCYHTPRQPQQDTCKLYFYPEPKANSTKRRVWDIKSVQQQLGEEYLDVTRLRNCTELEKLCAKAFDDISASKEDIVHAGEKALVSLYSGKKGKGLDEMRYQRYCQKVSTGTSQVQPQSLPPTSAAAMYHSMRVYYQLHQWKDEEEALLAEEWGWKVKNSQLQPIMTHLPPAPEALLHM
eukprot:gene1611-1782_t